MGNRKICIWKYDEDGFYQTDCRNTFCFNEGSIIDNQFNFCPWCGRKIVEKNK